MLQRPETGLHVKAMTAAAKSRKATMRKLRRQEEEEESTK
jgi:hypothetical protein